MVRVSDLGQATETPSWQPYLGPTTDFETSRQGNSRYFQGTVIPVQVVGRDNVPKAGIRVASYTSGGKLFDAAITNAEGRAPVAGDEAWYGLNQQMKIKAFPPEGMVVVGVDETPATGEDFYTSVYTRKIVDMEGNKITIGKKPEEIGSDLRANMLLDADGKPRPSLVKFIVDAPTVVESQVEQLKKQTEEAKQKAAEEAAARAAVEQRLRQTPAATPDEGSVLDYAIPILGILAGIGAAYYFFKRSKE